MSLDNADDSRGRSREASAEDAGVAMTLGDFAEAMDRYWALPSVTLPKVPTPTDFLRLSDAVPAPASVDRSVPEVRVGLAKLDTSQSSAVIFADRIGTAPSTSSAGVYEGLLGRTGVLIDAHGGGAPVIGREPDVNGGRPMYLARWVSPAHPPETVERKLRLSVIDVGDQQQLPVSGDRKWTSSEVVAAAALGIAVRPSGILDLVGAQLADRKAEVAFADVIGATPLYIEFPTTNLRLAALRGIAWPTGTSSVLQVSAEAPHDPDTQMPVGLHTPDGFTGPIMTAAIAGFGQTLNAKEIEKLADSMIRPWNEERASSFPLFSGYEGLREPTGPYAAASLAAMIGHIPIGVFDLDVLTAADGDYTGYVANSVRNGASLFVYAAPAGDSWRQHPKLEGGKAYLIGLECAGRSRPVAIDPHTGEQVVLAPNDLREYFLQIAVQAIPDWQQFLTDYREGMLANEHRQHQQQLAIRNNQPNAFDQANKIAGWLRLLRLL